MKVLFWISLVIALLGFLALAVVPSELLSKTVVLIVSFSSASIGCIGLVIYGVLTKGGKE